MVAPKLILVLLNKTSGFQSRRNAHGSTETQKYWFWLVKLMVFIQGETIMVASKLKSVGLV